MHMSYRALLVAAMLTLPSVPVLAQQPLTGSHLGAGTQAIKVEQFTSADEVDAIRAMLQAGMRTQALNAARAYVARVEKQAPPEETLSRYYAYNTLCTVYTSNGKGEEAEQACSRAMQLEPGKWSARNNRGTARLIMHHYDQALADYTAALELVPNDNPDIVATIQHNIALTRERRQGGN